MKTAHRRIAYQICSAVVFAGLSGCAVGGKSFSMDSNSRIPFFGLELKERKPKSMAPSYNSISRSTADGSRIEAAVGVGLSKPIELSSKPVDLLKNVDKRLANARIAGTIKNDASGSDIVSKEWAKRGSPESIPLPRTDVQPGALDRAENPSAVSFQ